MSVSTDDTKASNEANNTDIKPDNKANDDDIKNDDIKTEDKYSFNKTVANTLQGRIYLGRNKITNEQVIIKEAWKDLIKLGISRKKHKVAEDFLYEIKIGQLISNKNDCSPYICKTLDCWDDNDAYYCVLEKCDIGLFEFIKMQHRKMGKKVFKKNELLKKPSKWIKYIMKIFRDICIGVNWLHSNNICHLDLSLENTMLIKDGNGDHIPKIIDFGLAKEFPNGNFIYGNKVGKVVYMAPETYARKKYDPRKCDVHCLGVMLFMMLTGSPPYSTPTKGDQLYKLITKGKMLLILKSWKLLASMTEDAYDLIDKIIKPENDRISMSDVLKHKFLDPNN